MAADLSNAESRLSPARTPAAVPLIDRVGRWPWWALVAAILGVMIAWNMSTSTDYRRIFSAISAGLGVTIWVTLVAYGFALFLGLIVALGRVSKNFIIYQLSSFYVEVLRGVPILVLLLYIAFVVTPGAVRLVNQIGLWSVESGLTGDFAASMIALKPFQVSNAARVIFALSLAYSAFLAEIFRAGIESIDRGQVEAARALGMNARQAAIHIVLPQAFRRVLPPIVNDFIAMLKDSSLVSALGVLEITGLAGLNAANSFEVFRPYNVAAFLYLVMTLILSLFAKWVEYRFGQSSR